MEKQTQAEKLAVRILHYARNELMVAFRFLDLALCKPEFKPGNLETFALDGKYLIYNPRFIFRLYKEGLLNRSYLHVILHAVFSHPFVDCSIDQPLWDLACDIAVEAILDELNVKHLETVDSSAIAAELVNLQRDGAKLTAERLYKRFTDAPLSSQEYKRLSQFFHRDDHRPWYVPPQSGGTAGEFGQNGPDGSTDSAALSLALQAEWKEISQRIQVDLETASQASWGDRASNLLQNVAEVNRERYDYTSFLEKFAVLGEEMRINDDEFDYIFYTYGLQIYQNVPLIEPLEYKEVRRIKDFVIAIDTSGSTSGELVQKFVQKTYNVLQSTESFFSKINLHIIQCDAEIQEDVKITSREDFDEYLKTMTLKGFGGTDFRPVFRYVDALREKDEFDNLKGLIYFTDGYGDFPEQMPDYQAAFVFVDDEDGQPEVPVWAIKLVLRKDEI